jgi:hypothetical protein
MGFFFHLQTAAIHAKCEISEKQIDGQASTTLPTLVIPERE